MKAIDNISRILTLCTEFIRRRQSLLSSRRIINKKGHPLMFVSSQKNLSGEGKKKAVTLRTKETLKKHISSMSDVFSTRKRLIEIFRNR